VRRAHFSPFRPVINANGVHSGAKGLKPLASCTPDWLLDGEANPVCPGCLIKYFEHGSDVTRFALRHGNFAESRADRVKCPGRTTLTRGKTNTRTAYARGINTICNVSSGPALYQLDSDVTGRAAPIYNGARVCSLNIREFTLKRH